MAVTQMNPTLEIAPRRIAAQAPKLQRKDYVSTDYWLTVEQGHTFEDLQNPDYYAHIARKLRTNTLIYANAADGSFFAMLRVVSCGDAWAKVQTIIFNGEKIASGDPTPDRALYKIDHIGTGWRVIHRDTGKEMVRSLGQRGAAARFSDEILAAKTKQ